MLTACNSDKKTQQIGTQFKLNPSYKKVLKESKENEKPILLDFYTTWCKPCVWMDKDVFETSPVGDLLNENFVNVKIDAEKGEGPKLVQQFGVQGYPMLIFLNSNGEVVEKQFGMATASQVMDMAKRAAEANDALYVQSE